MAGSSSPGETQHYEAIIKFLPLISFNRKASPNEIREEYERLAKEKEERRLQQLTNPKGNITIHVNCTDIFNSYDTDYEWVIKILF